MTDEELKKYVDERIEKLVDERLSKIADDITPPFTRTRIPEDAGFALDLFAKNIRAALRKK